MNQILPNLDNHADFVRLLYNAGYEVYLNFVYPAGGAATPQLTVNNRYTGATEDVVGTTAMVGAPHFFSQWLDGIRRALGLYLGFDLTPEHLRSFGFEPGQDGLWKLKSPHSTGDVLLIDPKATMGGRLLSAIDDFGDEIRSQELYGPVSSLTDLNRILRERSWLGSSSESL